MLVLNFDELSLNGICIGDPVPLDENTSGGFGFVSYHKLGYEFLVMNGRALGMYIYLFDGACGASEANDYAITEKVGGFAAFRGKFLRRSISRRSSSLSTMNGYSEYFEGLEGLRVFNCWNLITYQLPGVGHLAAHFNDAGFIRNFTITYVE